MKRRLPRHFKAPTTANQELFKQLMVQNPARASSRVWTVEEKHVRYQRCSEQLGTRLARPPRKWGLRAGAQFKKPVPQEKKNFGLDTRRRLCGDRNEGESVGAQEAAGERVPNPSEHHRGRVDKEYQSAESENMLGRDWDIVSTRSRHVDVLVESLGLESGNTAHPIIDDVKKRESSVVGLRMLGVKEKA